MGEGKKFDPEMERGSRSAPHWRLIVDQGLITPEVENWHYHGEGTEDNPYAVNWIDNDPRNPMEFSKSYKWMITLSMAFATLAVSLDSSAFSGGIQGLLREFGGSQEVVTLGLSLYVLGFAIGPIFWAPLSELYGRQVLYFGTFACFAFFNAGVAGAQNMWTVIILRFFAGSFGSSPLTNAGGVIADCFPARERGLAMSIFAAAPFLGPAVGPVIGGFLGESAGWRWLMGFLAAFSGLCWILGTALVPETYSPVLLRRRAEKLSKMTGKVYVSKMDMDRGKVKLSEAFKTALSRPWILLFKEPIVLLLSIYMAIIYGTLYMLFAAYPIVYQQGRGWSEGIGGLSFIGVLIGMILAVLYSIFSVDKSYQATVDKHDGFAPPEARLPSAIIGGIALPIGLFWFSWTNSPSLPWAASMAAGIPFGFGMVLVFLSIMNYLVDAYTIFAASVLAANSILRSCFGAAFPLFTTQMYAKLGIHWASSIPAFLALACVPFPFLFYKYGATIRARCKYAAESAQFMNSLREQADGSSSVSDSDGKEESSAEKEKRREEHEAEEEAEVLEYSGVALPSHTRFQALHTSGPEHGLRHAEYTENPYDIDRVNTRESFGRTKSGTEHHTALPLSLTNSRKSEKKGR